MSRDTTPKFPPEIFDAIIDEAHFNDTGDDLETFLGDFSLVSKSWLQRSRYYLFQRVTVDVNEVKPFMTFLDSPLCTFKPYVHILELNECPDRGPLILWPANTLPRLSTLSAVRELWIDNGTFTSPKSVKTLSTFQNLQLLVMSGFYPGSPAQLLENLSICSSLKRISFRNLGMHHSNALAINSSPPSSLRFIQMSNSLRNEEVMEWLLSGEQVPAIETLALPYIEENECRAIGDVLQRLGPSLKNLEVWFSGNRFSETAFLRYVDLRYNTDLNSICFRSGPVASLLAQVTSSQVRKVVVDVGLGIIPRLREVDWDIIAKILDQPSFSKLEQLIIPGTWVRDEVYAKDEARHWMEQRLPTGRARDKLIICDQWSGNNP